MKFLKLSLFLFVFSLITSCSPEILADSQSNGIDGAQATNDNFIALFER